MGTMVEAETGFAVQYEMLAEVRFGSLAPDPTQRQGLPMSYEL